MAYPSFNDDDFDLLKKIATNTAEMAEGGISANNPLLNGYRLAGSRTIIPYDMGSGTVIDVEKPDNVKSVTSNVTLTFSNATPAIEKEFRLTLNADGTARTVTIPSSYSINRQGTITSVVVPASGTLILGFIYTGTRWNVVGDPVYGFNLGPSLADGTYAGITEPGVAGAALAFGDICYFNNNDSRWELVDANDADGYNKKLGMCVQGAAADGDATTMLLIGKIRADAKFPDMVGLIGAPVFMSETAGEIATVAPVTAAAAVRIVGFPNSADELFFSPSPDTIVLS